MYKYVMLYTINDYSNNVEGEYITLRGALKVLKKYSRVYIFRYNQDEDILYINYPFSIYYSTSKINIIENNDEDNIDSFGYIEVRLLQQCPSIKFSANMLDL